MKRKQITTALLKLHCVVLNAASPGTELQQQQQQQPHQYDCNAINTPHQLSTNCL